MSAKHAWVFIPVAILTTMTSGCQKAPPVPEGPRPVVVVEAKWSDLTPARNYTGIIRSRYETDLGFRVGGKVIKRFVDIGQRVQAGQILAELDPTDYELAVKTAEADLAATEAEARQAAAEELRNRDLIRSKSISQSEVEQWRANAKATRERVEKSSRNLQIAKNRREYCILKAEHDGIVIATPADSGQVVAEGATVVRIARSGEKEAVVNIPESRINDARTHTPILSVYSQQGKTFETKLRELSPLADPVTRTFQARFTIIDAPASLELGMTATIALHHPEKKLVIQLPTTAIVQAEQQPRVWIANKDGTLNSVNVEVVEYGRDFVAISGGLKGGEKVVRAGVHKLDSGLKVRIVEDKR